MEYRKGVYCENTNCDFYTFFKYYAIAAKKGHPKAQYRVGLFFEISNNFLNKDLKKSFKFYSRSAKQKNHQAMYKLAEFYRDGTYVRRDLKKAIKLFNDVGKLNSRYEVKETVRLLVNEFYYLDALHPFIDYLAKKSFSSIKIVSVRSLFINLCQARDDYHANKEVSKNQQLYSIAVNELKYRYTFDQLKIIESNANNLLNQKLIKGDDNNFELKKNLEGLKFAVKEILDDEI